MHTKIAVGSFKNKIGIIKVNAKINFETKVDIVDSHISFVVCLFSDSSEMWIPIASDIASAIAITIIPPRTTIEERVPEFNPTIKPSVVIIPEVRPKLNPFLIERFMNNIGEGYLNNFLEVKNIKSLLCNFYYEKISKTLH